MIIGVFSDAHANEIGFYQCYDFLKIHADILFYLGDSVGYFPLSNKIIDTLRTEKINCLKGNHDAMLIGEIDYEDHKEEIYQLKKSRRLLRKENFEFLQQLPIERTMTVNNKKLLFVHGSPSDPMNGYVFPDFEMASFQDLPFSSIFMGHTHRPFIKKLAGKNIVNVGSCGLPRDIGNRTTVVLFDTLKNSAELIEFNLNTKEVIHKYKSEVHTSVISVLTRDNKIFNNE